LPRRGSPEKEKPGGQPGRSTGGDAIVPLARELAMRLAGERVGVVDARIVAFRTHAWRAALRNALHQACGLVAR
jgi:hypothetical protein